MLLWRTDASVRISAQGLGSSISALEPDFARYYRTNILCHSGMILKLTHYSHPHGTMQYAVAASWESCLQELTAYGVFALPGWRQYFSKYLYRDTEPSSSQQEKVISKMCPAS